MVEMIWKEPPPVVSSEKAAVLAELQKHPGRWALVQAAYKSTSGANAWKKLGCEATHRRTEAPGAYDIYARWPEAKTKGVPHGQNVISEELKPGYPKPPTMVRPAGPGMYKPEDRDARGVPSNGLPASILHKV